MRDVLSGTKGFIHTHAIRKIHVPKYREVTVDTVYEKVKDCQNIMYYLPDFNKEKYKPSQVLERKFMFEIINSVDSNFFLELIQEIEEYKHPIVQQKPEMQVVVCEELAELIEFGVAGKRVSGSARLMSQLKAGAKKRKAPKQKDKYKIVAKINPNAKHSLFGGSSSFLERVKIETNKKRQKKS